jgi:hypothetical protein
LIRQRQSIRSLYRLGVEIPRAGDDMAFNQLQKKDDRYDPWMGANDCRCGGGGIGDLSGQAIEPLADNGP